MEDNFKELILLVQKSVLRDIELKLKKRVLIDEIVPDNVFEVLKELEKEYSNEKTI